MAGRKLTSRRRILAQLMARLDIDDPRFIEMESKRRVVPEDADKVRRFLERQKGLRLQQTSSFFDQFIDTPTRDLFRKGASLRLRYKRFGSYVYLQYKGPGFHKQGIFYRSEFSSERLKHVLLEESHHDIVHFQNTSIQGIVREHVPPAMERAMQRHLGPRILQRLNHAPMICFYQKEKFIVPLGDAFLEPSLDRVFAFFVHRKGLHPLSSFCEYENEIKAKYESLEAKLKYLGELAEFDARVARRFKLPLERMDKYHRCASFFYPG